MVFYSWKGMTANLTKRNDSLTLFYVRDRPTGLKTGITIRFKSHRKSFASNLEQFAN